MCAENKQNAGKRKNRRFVKFLQNDAYKIIKNKESVNLEYKTIIYKCQQIP